MARVERELLINVAHATAFSSLKQNPVTVYQKTDYTPPFDPNAGHTVAIGYMGGNSNADVFIDQKITNGGAGALLYWNSNRNGDVIANNRQPMTSWKHSGGGNQFNDLKASAHILGPGQTLETLSPLWAVTSMQGSMNIGVLYDAHMAGVTSLISAQLGSIVSGQQGRVMIGGEVYTLDSNNAWAAELAQEVAMLALTLSESADVESEPPAAIYVNRGSEASYYEWDINVSGRREVEKDIVAYTTESGKVLKTRLGVKAQVDLMNTWLLEREAAIVSAFRLAAADGTPVPSTVANPSLPPHYDWLNEAEQKQVNDWLANRRKTLVDYNSSSSSNATAIDDAYDDYVAKLPVGETAMSKADWLENILSASDDAKGLGGWLSSVGGTIKGFASGVVGFVTENPGLTGLGAAAIGAKSAGIPSWAIWGGVGAALLLLFK